MCPVVVSCCLCVCACVRVKWSRNCSEMGRWLGGGCRWRPWFELTVSELATLLTWCHFSFQQFNFMINVTYLILQSSFRSLHPAKPRTDMAMACSQWINAWGSGWTVLFRSDLFSSSMNFYDGMLNFEKTTIWQLSFHRMKQHQIVRWMGVVHLP